MNKKTTPFIIAATIIITVIAILIIKNQTGKNYVVGIVNPKVASDDMTKGFIKGLAEYGYVEGENLSFIKCEGKKDMDTALQDMIARNVDLIFTVTTPATKKAKKMTADNKIPVVFIMLDPVALGVIENMTKPTGNVTGIKLRGSSPKAFEWLLAVAPDVKNVYVPIKYDTKAARMSIKDLKKTARQFGMQLTVAEFSTTEDLKALPETIPQDVDAIFIPRSLSISPNIKSIVQAGIARKIPTVGGSSQFQSGAVLSFGPNRFLSGKQASRLAHRILQGIKVIDTPTEVADFYLGINLNTAGKSDIEISNDILLNADTIIR
ncbi:ABC transporter substrate-binding protein [Thermodesulfobacteriota bacterium]